MFSISKYIHINKGSICQDGQEIWPSDTEDFALFSKEVYKTLDIQYPKFHKMDNLCKLAFLASEFVLKDNDEQDVALLFCNRESSLDTDRKHQQTIQHQDAFYPSPAIFVYTLPNIAIGEVSIRHQLKTESVFLLSDQFQTDYIYTYTQYLLEKNKAKKVLCGWLEMLKDHYQAIFYLVGREGFIAHTQENIEKIIR